MSQYEPVYLHCVKGTSDKVYHMKANEDGKTWTATYGRWTGPFRTHIWPLTEWDKKLYEKRKKGYKDYDPDTE